MTIAAASATLASFTGLRGLALLTGWPPQLAWLLPVTLDAYAMTAARVWLTPTTTASSARRFARANALGAITASIAGNAAYHAIHAELLHVTWPIIVIVGAVPATVLGLTAHLHALRGRHPSHPRRPAGSPDPHQHTRTNPARRHSTHHSRPRLRTEDDLYAAALEADTRYRAEHGRPITRDALRSALRISGPRATELRRRLTTRTVHADQAPDSSSPAPDRKETPHPR